MSYKSLRVSFYIHSMSLLLYTLSANLMSLFMYLVSVQRVCAKELNKIEEKKSKEKQKKKSHSVYNFGLTNETKQDVCCLIYYLLQTHFNRDDIYRRLLVINFKVTNFHSRFFYLRAL